MDGCVYVIKAANGLYKVGRTCNFPRRFKALTHFSPVTLEIISTNEVYHANELESKLHAMFARNRSHGEWFDLTREELREAQDFIYHWPQKETQEPSVISFKIVSFRLPDDLLIAAKGKAKLEETTLSQVVRQLLRQWVAGNEIEHTQPCASCGRPVVVADGWPEGEPAWCLTCYNEALGGE